MLPDDLLAGKAMESKVHEIYKNTVDAYPLKITTLNYHGVTFFVYRCNRFENILDYLGDHGKIGLLETQHNILKIFLRDARFPNNVSFTEVMLESGNRLDLVVDGKSFELKTMQDLDWHDISPFISTYYHEMILNMEIKTYWDLCFFAKRLPPKDKKRRVCLYYLVVIEVTASKLKGRTKNKSKDILIEDTQEGVNQVIQQVRQEDGIEADDGILFPVKNFLIVDKLREDKKQLKQIIKEKDQLIIDKDQIIVDKDQIIVDKDQDKKKLKKIIDEKDQIIADLRKKLKDISHLD